ncbi:MAG: MogA/MoaB family molybdenum cofactor biosynthesis protein [Bryobacteraceae bacterium]|nr:MogA/MoaB family molybdenum cofactor biosynthesis protein [Bryobacteraceae bacterium]
MIRVAVLTISDSCAARLREDASGPAVAGLCEAQGWSVMHREILPDEPEAIRRRLEELADSGAVELILTTGGTGIAERDSTPEATRAVLGKELPGLAELMRAEGLRHTRRAVLSRAVAGTRGRCLIVNLPGSPKGAVQSLNAILDLVPHIADLLRGRTAHGEGP